MRTRTLLFAMTIALAAGFTACEKNDTGQGSGKAEFSVMLPGSTLKSAMSDSSAVPAYHLLISVEDMEGTEVLSDEMVPLYPFGEGYVSEKVELKTGKYRLTKFMIVDASGEVLYATPLRGSPLAYLVKHPLPLPFAIRPEATTTLHPEVLPVQGHQPDDFGYVGFVPHIVKPLHVYVVCYLDNPWVMMPTRPTRARLTVFDRHGWHYTFKIRPEVNHIIIRGGSEEYLFVVEKEGYKTQRYLFKAEELRKTSPDNPLWLKIPFGEPPFRKLVLKPGPEKGQDAMISNLEPDRNFGDYKYFEATYLSEPQLAVMRSNRSLIRFDLNALPKSARIRKVILRLYFDRPIPWDSTVFISDTSEATDGRTWYGAVLQRIISPWEEDSVTWDHPPKTTEKGQVFVPPFHCSRHYVNIDVTRLYLPGQDEISAARYGMFFRLWPEDRFPGFRFASSDYPDPKMWPELIIYYTLDR